MRTESAPDNNVDLFVNDQFGATLVSATLELAVSPTGDWSTITLIEPVAFSDGDMFEN